LWLPIPRPYIHDPYSANERFFSKCEGVVADSVNMLIKNMMSQAG
jgi:hypothetical protein